ncbi:hypothetical protein AGMMS49525_15430 [Bacteroidia bacterium]|nr:hypothetical protein AGMMS49525_15430 [Bacteroidia bacterium]
MSKQKGTKKTGGRAKGTPNKVTTDLRTWINELLNDNRKQFIADLKKLEPQQRVMIFEKMLSYAIPKMQSVEAVLDFNRLTDEQIDSIISEISKQIENDNKD